MTADDSHDIRHEVFLDLLGSLRPPNELLVTIRPRNLRITRSNPTAQRREALAYVCMASGISMIGEAAKSRLRIIDHSENAFASRRLCGAVLPRNDQGCATITPFRIVQVGQMRSEFQKDEWMYDRLDPVNRVASGYPDALPGRLGVST